MKKVVKLTQKQVRGLITEAIQGRNIGDPEPFSIQEATPDEAVLEAIEDKLQHATALIGEAKNMAPADLADKLERLFEQAYLLMDEVEERLG